MTKASPLHLIDRLQFPWLTASIVIVAASTGKDKSNKIAVLKQLKQIKVYDLKIHRVYFYSKLFKWPNPMAQPRYCSSMQHVSACNYNSCLGITNNPL